MTAPLLPLTADDDTKVVNPVGPNSFWSRNKTLINFWLDAILLVLFLLLTCELVVLRLVFPRNAGDRWQLAGQTIADWQELICNTFGIFAAGILLHVMLHWQWICCTVQTRLLHQKATKNDGVQTLIGVGLLFCFVNLIGAVVLYARWAIVETQ